jgi:hypothetical protein
MLKQSPFIQFVNETHMESPHTAIHAKSTSKRICANISKGWKVCVLHKISKQTEELAGLKMRCKGMLEICDHEASQ